VTTGYSSPVGDVLGANERRLLAGAPTRRERALDVGCGSGTFARELATRFARVDAVDRSAEMIVIARRRWSDVPNLRFLEGDFLDLALRADGYDFVVCIAAVHHMPFEAALRKLRDVLRPGGVLALLGLHRNASVADYTAGAVSLALRGARRLGEAVGLGPGRSAFESRVVPPLAEPRMTLREIRAGAERVLPGARVRRHLGFRYSVWFEKR
jgi:SAM-dependent methyltransferase